MSFPPVTPLVVWFLFSTEIHIDREKTVNFFGKLRMLQMHYIVVTVKALEIWQAHQTSDAKTRGCKIHLFQEAHLRVGDGLVDPDPIDYSGVLDLLLFINCVQSQKSKILDKSG